ncbi:MAG: TolC family protein [Arcobacter sp.]|nr:TolC family protein [Arcobacter sp.]
MKKISFKKSFVALALLTTYTSAENLQGVLKDILHTNPDILEKQKTYNSSIYDKDISKSGYLPTLVFEGEGGYQGLKNSSTNYDYEDDLYYEAKLTARQTIYDWGKVGAEKKAKNAYAYSNLYKYVRTSNDVIFKSIKAYIDVLKYYNLKELALENVAIHENILKSVKMRMEAGKQGRSELERVLGRLSTAKTRLLLRQSEFERALHNMHKYLGRFVDYKDMTKPSFEDNLLPVSLKQAFDTQISSHPTFLQGYYSIKQREFEYERQKKDNYGKLYLEASGKIHNERKQRHDEDVYGVLKYDYTIYSGGKNTALKLKAKTLVHEEQQKQLNVRRVLMNDLQLTWSSYKLLYSQIGELKKSLYFTKKALETYKEEFRIGRRMLITILDAQNEYQNAKEQLLSVRYDLLSEKFRVLYSQGTLLKDLNLLSAQMENLLKKDAKLKVMVKDKLPLNRDFDKDGVKNREDLSVNNIPQTLVNALGVDKKMMKLNKIDESIVKNIKEKVVIINNRKDMRNKPVKPGVLTRFDFVSFKPKSIELSTGSKDVMRYLIKQIKNYSSEGMIFIKIGTEEFKNENKNRKLALSRAYNFKRILQAHNIDKDSIQVFADTKTKDHKSYLGLKIINSAQDYKNQYDSEFFDKSLWNKKSTKLTQEAKKLIRNLSETIKKRDIALVDFIIYSNDYKNPIKNKRLSEKRQKSIQDEFVKNGISKDKLMLFPWGELKRYKTLMGSNNKINYNKVEYVLREK